MRSTIALAVLLLSSSCMSAAPAAMCDRPDSTMRFYGPELSLDEMEQIGRTLAARNPAAPQVPFARAHGNWLWLKAHHRDGDKIIAFEGPQGHDGLPFAWGYALLRGQCLVGLLTTRRA